MKSFTKILIISFFIFFIFLFLKSDVSAQSFTLTPSSGSIAINGFQNVEIRADNPPTVNVVELHITVPGNLVNITNLVIPSGGSYVVFSGAGCSSYYTSSTVCYVLGKTGSGNVITDNELLGTFTLEGEANGVANVNFVAGTKYANGSDYIATGATFTIGTGGGIPQNGTLPSTAISFKKNKYLMYSFLFFTLSFLSFFTIDYLRHYKVYTLKRLKFKYLKDKSKFENKF